MIFPGLCKTYATANPPRGVARRRPVGLRLRGRRQGPLRKSCLTHSQRLGYKSLNAVPSGMPLLMTSRILIADDHEDNRELMRLMLQDGNYDVHEACDGHECLQLARERHPDLIMIDISMPRLDGWEVFQQLQADERTSDIPCVAVTGYPDLDRQRALQAGFVAFLGKPFRGEAFMQMVKQVLAGETARASVAASARKEF